MLSLIITLSLCSRPSCFSMPSDLASYLSIITCLGASIFFFQQGEGLGCSVKLSTLQIHCSMLQSEDKEKGCGGLAVKRLLGFHLRQQQPKLLKGLMFFTAA